MSETSPITAQELAEHIGAEVVGDGQLLINGCARIDAADEDQLTFVSNRRYLSKLKQTKAGAVVLSQEDAETLGEQHPSALLIASDPYFAFRQALVRLVGFRDRPAPGVSELAVIDPTAKLGEDCTVGPYCVLGPGVVVGDRTVLHAHVWIDTGSTVGQDCILFPQVCVYDGCVIGDRVTLHAACVIGQDGYGYATHPGEDGGAPIHHKIPPTGNTVIEDDVEIGCHCSVDRATMGSTVVKTGTKLCNGVTIGHGATIGRHNLLVGQVGIAGSTSTGDYVAMGGQVGVAGHLHIGDGARLAAKAGVMRDLPGGETYGGQPAQPLSDTKRQVLAAARLPDALAELKRLKRRVKQLERRLADSGEAS